MDLNINSMVKLNNEIEMPIFGLGTWLLSGNSAHESVLWALEAGYRLIDTATIYDNEREIGKAIKDSGIPRDELFITTKVWNDDQGYNNTISALNKSLKKLELSYVDLYLIHWPVTGLRNNSWKALEKVYNEGKTRAIGVSNYTIRHLKEHFENFSMVPTVNQVEFSPFLYQKELMEFCKSQNIYIEAYCPLTRGRRLNHLVLKGIAHKFNKTTAQVLIRWGLQHEIIEIPKSGNKEHIYENANVFDFNLDHEAMKKIDDLNEDYRVVDDPNDWE